MATGDVNAFLLAKPTLLGTTSTSVVPTVMSHDYTVKQIIICNTDSVDRLVTLAVGSSATAGNCFVYRLPVAGGDTVVLDTAITLNYVALSGGALTGLCDTGSVVTVTVTGWRTEL